MISSSKSKLLRSLHQKKFRDQHRLFIVEGEKMVSELMEQGSEQGFELREVFATPEWLDENTKKTPSSHAEFNEASRAEIKKVSALVSPQAVLALVSMPEVSHDLEGLVHNTVLAFESIRDPGNLGTIIRTADWFGIRHIVCSQDSTDVFNPKVIQSTMGAYARVKVSYHDLPELLESLVKKEKVVYGTFLEGENIYHTEIQAAPLILFGNESRGLSQKLNAHIQAPISIPSFSTFGQGSESLNVASSVAVVCSEIKRRN